MEVIKDIRISGKTIKFLDEFNTVYTFELEEGKKGCAVVNFRSLSYYFRECDNTIVAYLLFGNKLLSMAENSKHESAILFSDSHDKLLKYNQL